jgi:transposase InsO family protein
MIGKTWRDTWEHVVAFLAVPPDLRRVVYTTNTIEALHRQIRKTIKPEDTSPPRRLPANSSTSRSTTPRKAGRTPTTGAQHCSHSKSTSETDCPDTQKVGHPLVRRRPKPGLVHHSDRGSQYTSLAFGRTLRDSGLLASMGRRGDAYDNAPVESVISTIKNELVNPSRFTTRDQARLAVFDYIETFYNPRRLHSALGHRSPDHYERIKLNQEPRRRCLTRRCQHKRGNLKNCSMS